MDKILIKNARFAVYLGVGEAERKQKQDIFIDAELYVNIKSAAVNDAIEETINYSNVYKSIASLLAERAYRLIETVVEVIAQRVLAEFPVSKIRITIKKPGALSRAEYAGVEIVRER